MGLTSNVEQHEAEQKEQDYSQPEPHPPCQPAYSCQGLRRPRPFGWMSFPAELLSLGVAEGQAEGKPLKMPSEETLIAGRKGMVSPHVCTACLRGCPGDTVGCAVWVTFGWTRGRTAGVVGRSKAGTRPPAGTMRRRRARGHDRVGVGGRARDDGQSVARRAAGDASGSGRVPAAQRR